jgi:alpha-beta hydrolase superfamily lysophospholipase
VIEGSFTDVDDIPIHLRRWEPVETSRGAVVIVHGASEHAGRYGRTAEHLANAGYWVLAPDLRGHGRTASATGVGIIGDRRVDGVLDGIDQVVTMAADVAGSGPVVLLGHSMGSLYALRYSELRASKLSGLVLSGPVGVIAGIEDMIAGIAVAIEAGARDELLPALAPFNAAFGPARTPFDWLSRDAAEVDAYLADPMCGDRAPLTYGFVLANLEVARDGILHLDDVGHRCPVLIVAGESDPVSGFGVQARELARRLGQSGASVTERFYPGARHEVLNEINRDEVLADITQWLHSCVDGTRK